MWTNWSEKAASSLTSALEKTGDAISKAATTAGKSAQKGGGDGGSTEEEEEHTAVGGVSSLKEGEMAEAAAATTAEGDTEDKGKSSSSSSSWISNLEKLGGKAEDPASTTGGESKQEGAQRTHSGVGVGLSSMTASFTQALEKTGDVISKAATSAGKSARTNLETASKSALGNLDSEAMSEEEAARRERKLGETFGNLATTSSIKNIQMGWSNVVETTKTGLKQAESSIKKQEAKLKQKLAQAKAELYKRDPKMPLDVPALKDAEVVYVTDRIITMSHPAMASRTHPDIISGERKLSAVQHLLQRRHASKYMIWNLSEIEYDVQIFDSQVLTFSFPGSPCPPLGLLLKILISIESWLHASDDNVAVIHCLTGKGRTSTVLAAFLTWMNEAGFHDVYESLQYVAQCKQLTVDELTIPSQRRYTSYFKNMLDGIKPSQPPLMLKRIILSEAPKYAKGPALTDEQKKKLTDGDDEEAMRMGCAPYLQIFKAGKLLHTAPASIGYSDDKDQDKTKLPFCQVADGSISFHVNLMVQGDILIRCRHLTTKRQRVSMFRAALHTGYVPPKIMRITKSQLDGACHEDDNDADSSTVKRFPDDFFMDLIFEPVSNEEAGQALLDEESEVSTAPENANHIEGGVTYRASAYDTMLHRDSRFWDVIADRKKAHAEDSAAVGGLGEGEAGDDANTKNDPNWGRTVGRRRTFNAKTAAGKGGGNDVAGSGTSSEAGVKEGGAGDRIDASAVSAALETFSIGGELDFLPETIEPEHSASAGAPSKSAQQPKQKPKPKKKKKRDTLMEALMGALDEPDTDNEFETEEIVFGQKEPEVTAPEPAPTIVDLPPPNKESTSPPAAASTATEGDGSAESKKNESSATTAAAAAAAADDSKSDGTDEAEKPDQQAPAKSTDAAAGLNDEMDDLLADEDLDGAIDGIPDDGDGDEGDIDLDDAELEDLESFLGAK